MLSSRIKTLIVASALLCCISSFARERFPNHCTATEKTLISAKMQKIITSKAGDTYQPTGKILSICINQKGSTITKMVYRYGTLGKVELEQVASVAAKWVIFYRYTTSHSGENIIGFKNNSFRYYVSDATGQGSGVGLTVYKSGKKIKELNSGMEEEADFVSHLQSEFEFEKIKSPILINRGFCSFCSDGEDWLSAPIDY